MSAAKDRPVSRPPTRSYRDNFDRIFRRQENAPPPEDILDQEDFYNLMQTYRHAKVEDQRGVVDAFEAVKTYIRGLTV